LKSLVEEEQNLYSTKKLTSRLGNGIMSTFSLYMSNKDLKKESTESVNDDLIKRYEVTVFDARQWSGNKYGVFIVPQGREHEWLVFFFLLCFVSKNQHQI
jgi:hypothetical protein